MSTHTNYRKLFYGLVQALEIHDQIRDTIQDLDHGAYADIANMQSVYDQNPRCRDFFNCLEGLSSFLNVSDGEIERYIQKLQPFFMKTAQIQEPKEPTT